MRLTEIQDITGQSHFPRTTEEVIQVCSQMFLHRSRYWINDDFSINVSRDVTIDRSAINFDSNLTIPVKFNIINGSFTITDPVDDFEGFPKEILGSFKCGVNRDSILDAIKYVLSTKITGTIELFTDLLQEYEDELNDFLNLQPRDTSRGKLVILGRVKKFLNDIT